jgi:hypothetical protein
VSVVSINGGNLFHKGSNGQESTQAKHIDPLILQCFNGMLLKARDVQIRQVRIPLSPPFFLNRSNYRLINFVSPLSLLRQN